MLDTCRPRDLYLVIDQLRGEFGTLPSPNVERCVADTFRRARHLGFEVTPGLVKRVAREHLRAMLNSAPPSGLDRSARSPSRLEPPVPAAH